MLPLILVFSTLLSLFATVADAGSISRPSKSFGGTSFINGVVPQASDFNGDIDTMYAEFNGNIDNSNIDTAAAISPTKISPDGFTVNVRTIHALPCTILEESDQAADTKRWAMCVSGGVLQIGTYTDAGALQNNWFTITRANGGFTLGGTSGTNTVNGATTFNQTVTFTGGTTIVPTGSVTMFMGTTAPGGWLLMDGATTSCTGGSGVNANLCAQLVGLFGSVNYKGASFGTFTVDTASNEIIHVGHGRATNEWVHFTSTTTLPAPLAATTVYCIISFTTDRFKISTTCGGAEIDITTTGSGTHSDYIDFVIPDARGRNALGTGTGPGLSARVIGATGGSETVGDSVTGSHVLTIAQIPSHTHVQNFFTTDNGGSFVGTNGFQATPTNGGSTDATGGGGGHTHTITPLNPIDPFLVMTFIIKL